VAKAAESGHEAPESLDIEVGTGQLAFLLNVDERTIRRLAVEGMPKEKRGTFRLRAALEWFVTYRVKAARGEKGLNDLDVARERKTLAEARIAEIDLSDREGRTIPLELHISRLRDRCESVAGAVKAIGRYQPDIKAATSDEAADALCDRMSDEILAELHGLVDTIE
jgi:phage terminase Nu1 subunit (DNA packaging protein)